MADDEPVVNGSALGRSDGLTNQCERCSTLDEDTLMLLSTCEVCPDCMRPLHQRSPSPLPLSAQGIRFSPGPGPVSQQCSSTKLDAVIKNIAETGGSENKT